MSITSQSQSHLMCNWCLSSGHTEDSCFAKQASQQLDKENARKRHSRNTPKCYRSSHSTSHSIPKPSPTVSTSHSHSNITPFKEYAVNATTLLSTGLSTPRSDWCVDSGCSSHMTPHRSFFVEYTPHVIPILIANGHIIHSAGIGTVHFKPIVKGHPANVVILKNVLHVPELSQSLLSVMCLTVKHGYKVVIVRDCIYFYTKGSLVLTAKLFGNLAYLNGTTLHQPTSASALNTTASPLDITLWHRRFSHLNYTDLNAMVKKNLVTGLTLSSHASPDPICEPCLAGHQRRIVNRSATHQDTPLAVVHADLHSPLPTQSPEGFRYWCIFVDECTRHWSVFFLKSKDQAFQSFKSYKAWIELQSGYKIKALQDDKGGEFMSNEFEQYLASEGIQRRHTMRNEPHSNGVAERAIGVISNRATSLLHESHLPPSFWPKAVSAVIHTHNRMPTSVLPNSTPFTALFNKKPDVSLLISAVEADSLKDAEKLSSLLRG